MYDLNDLTTYMMTANKTFVLLRGTESLMSLLASVSIIMVATFLATWYNDKISKAEYIGDDHN